MLRLISRLNRVCFNRFGGAILPILLLLALHTVAAAPALKQRTFASPDAAVIALAQAIKANNTAELMMILGPGSEDLISSGDDVQDRAQRKQFSKSYAEKKRLETDSGGTVRLIIGKDDWPFPFPIVKEGRAWRFDTQAGREEVLSRRIGENELSAIQVCLAIVDAERDYAVMTGEKRGLPHYARRFESSKGKRDGLYWETQQGEAPSPLGPLVAQARAEGYSDSLGKAEPYHGYLYKILTAQGKDANGGELSYLVRERLVGGFAVVAFPAVYGSSGINTFIVNHEGVVYWKDLGKDTARIALSMTAFNPDKTWKQQP